MSARRQPSATSLSRYARSGTPELSDKSLDFCNAFWGLGDGGVDVLFARMRGAARTMEELRNFWKERAAIEEQYARRLAALSKYTLGRDEIGELRASLDTLKGETEKQAGFHLMVAQQIKTELEGPTNSFLEKQTQHKRTVQAAVEKEFKAKQYQESHVNKAREKYESDCLKINSFTAQSTLMQGRDLEKLNLKLERTQQTVQANERDFANFARVLQATAQKWEGTWKAFCDSCQDLEEERLEFMKDNMWAYANAVSIVCVADDESCERLRLALEQLEPERDMENFVHDYGTGNAIPDPPAFVNYANPEAVPSSSQRPTTHPAGFARTSQRARQVPPSPQPPEEEEPPMNMTGVGRGGGRATDASPDPSQLQRVQSRSRSRSRAPPQEREPLNGYPETSASAPVSRMQQQPPAGGMRMADPQADPIDPTAKTMIKIGDNAYEVDLSRDPQAQAGVGSSIRPNGTGPVNVGQEDDPLARQMEELQRTASSARGQSVRRSGQLWGMQPPQALPPPPPATSGSPVKRDAAAKLSPPPGGSTSSAVKRDYRRSAEIVVGLPPTSVSRSPSPAPPTAAHMLPPSNTYGGPSGGLPVQDILRDYQQSFPGEHKSTSRPASRSGSAMGHHHSQSQSQNQIQHDRSLSISGHAGIGAQGRSTSPQPAAPPSRGTSPAQPASRNGHRVPPPAVNGSVPTHGHAPSQGSVRQNSISVPQAAPHHQRPTSPNSVGIVIDPSGRVAQDVMADRYTQQRQPHQVTAPPPAQPAYTQQPPPAPPVQVQQNQQRQPTYSTSPNGYATPQSQSYGVPAPAGPVATTNYPHSYAPPAAAPPPPSHQGMYDPYQAVQYQQPPAPPSNMYDQSRDYGNQGAVVPNVQRGASMNGYYGQGVGHGHGQQHSQSGFAYRAPSPARAPSPQPPPNQQMGMTVRGTGQPPQQQQQQQPPPPTGQYTEDGRGVLFYVKAMYDYQATIDEEFDFQAGDIIAVTATPEDGWWSGELLDEERKQPGRHVFPSNFVCLF